MNPAAALRRLLPALALILAVVLAYWNSLRNPFLFDDEAAVLRNPTIHQLWSLDALRPPADGSTTTGRPLVNLSLALNHAIGGEDSWNYHALNLAIHAAAALALLGLVRRTLLRSAIGASAASPAAFFVALLWALHPLQTETVVGIAQRTESLCGLFYLLTLYAFARSAAGDVPAPAARRWIVVSIVCCLLGMGSKEVMVTAPLVVLLFDRTFFAGSFAAAWRRRRGYYVALAATWLLLGWLVWRGGGARGTAAGFGLGVTWWNYLLTQCEAIVLYLRLSLWPHPLVLDYGTAVAASLAAVWWQGILVLGLLGATAWALVRRPAAGFVGAWFFLVLAPSSSFVPLVTQTIAEHRMYLPLAAVVAVVVLAMHRLPGRGAVGALTALAIAAGACTIARNRDYRDSLTIWSDTVAKRPANPRAHNNLALALQQADRPVEAGASYAQAVALDPGYVSARYNWGVALLEQGDAAAAVEQLQAAVRLAPGHADAWLNLGNALLRLGRATEAVGCFETVLRLAPAADAHYNLGVALAATRQAAAAAAQFRAALALQPDLAAARFEIARLDEQAGRIAEAIRGYEETLRLSPGHADALRRLGLLLARTDRLADAAEVFRTLVRLAPADADARANLGNALLLSGRVREAVAEYEEALRLRPGDERTLQNLRLAREALR